VGGEEILIEENTENVSEAVEALIALGYTEKEAQKVLDSVNKNDTLENIIKNSLRLLMN